MVRKAVGYPRYETEEELLFLNQLYAVLHWYTNFFQSVIKLKVLVPGTQLLSYQTK